MSEDEVDCRKTDLSIEISIRKRTIFIFYVRFYLKALTRIMIWALLN